MKTRLALCLFIAGTSLSVPGCDFQSSVNIHKDDAAGDQQAKGSDRFKFFIHGKKVSNLSEDQRTLTLSIDAADPDGGDLKIEWLFLLT